jgi:potassium channel subfamily K
MLGCIFIVDLLTNNILYCNSCRYGDLKTGAGRILNCVFALSGAAFLGVLIGVLGGHVIALHERSVEKTAATSETLVLNLFSTQEQMSSIRRSLGREDRSESFLDEKKICKQPEKSRWHRLWMSLRHFCLIAVILIVFALLEAGDPGISEEWDFGSALYFSVIAATTVGCGDLAPQTQKGRFVALIFVPLTVVAMGHWLATIVSSIIDSRKSGFRKQLEVQQLSLELLEAMDEDGDGKVTPNDFLEFMLIAMNKVDRELILELRAHFSHLDSEDKGFLSKDQLIDTARRELHNPRRKLELSRYKQGLPKSSSKMPYLHPL